MFVNQANRNLSYNQYRAQLLIRLDHYRFRYCLLTACEHVAKYTVCSLLAGKLHAHKRALVLYVKGHMKTCAVKINSEQTGDGHYW